MFKEAFIIGKMMDGQIPDQYMQDYRYWEKHKDAIKLYFGGNIGTIDKVAVHVRRGDYVGSDFHADLFKTNYYQRAMQLFPNSNFLVFSDDIEWCKKQKIFKGCEFSQNTFEIDDLNDMASCKSIIMANSTFSWWAAFLNPHIESFYNTYDPDIRGMAIRPNGWFLDYKERITFPPKWINMLEQPL